MHTQNVLWVGQARTIVDAVESWRRTRVNGNGLWELEVVVRLALDTGSALPPLVGRMYATLFDGGLPDVPEAGRLLVEACARMEDAVRLVLDVATDVRCQGLEVARADQLPGLLTQLRSLRDNLQKNWPAFDEEELRRGCAAADRGELLDVEDILRELESSGHC